jgi:hypothetical protein
MAGYAMIGGAVTAWGEEAVVWPQMAFKDHPKIQNILEGLIAEARAGRALALPTLAGKPLESLFAFKIEKDRIEVVIEAVSEAGAAKVTESVRQLGGGVEIVSKKLLQAMVPIQELEKLAALAEVVFIRLPIQAQPNPTPALSLSGAQGSVVSEGAAQIGAPAWHQAGVTGEGRTVTLIDTQFGNFQRLLGAELPPADRVTTRSFRSDGRLFPTGAPENQLVHGTAIAEIVHDIAPGARHYWAAFRTDVEWRQAVDWAISQKPDVIGSSIVWRSSCLRGGGIFEPLQTRARENGILWVTSGGNDADAHWDGTFMDQNNNTQHEWAPGDEEIVIEARLVEGEIRGERLPVATIVMVYSWDAPCTGANDDYEVVLFRPNDSRPFGGDWFWTPGIPIKFTGWTFGFRDLSVGDRVRFRAVLQKQPGAPAARFDMVMPFCSACLDWEHSDPRGSVSFAEPRNSPNVMAVGAVHHDPNRCPSWASCPNGLLEYSSRGPTKDGRIKPDIVAPSHVSTASYGRFTGGDRGQGATGTSFSQPHATGAALLAKQAFPNLSPAQLQDFLEKRAEDRGPPGKDNDWGTGLLVLGRAPGTQQPDLRVNPASLAFSAQQNGPNPPAQDVQITNAGGGTLNWTAVADVPWISLSASSGTAPATLSVSVNIAGLPAGTHQGKVVISAEGAANSPATVNVTLTIQAPPPTISVSPASLLFSGQAGGATPASQTLTISNTGGGTLNWSVSTNVPWLSVSPSSGSAPPSANVTVSVNIAGLSAGQHHGQITLTAAGATNSPVIVPVTLTLTPAGAAGELLVLQFVKLEFVTPAHWERTVKEGCVIYKNVSPGPSQIRVTLVDNSVREYEIGAGREVIVCGNAVHIDTR